VAPVETKAPGYAEATLTAQTAVTAEAALHRAANVVEALAIRAGAHPAEPALMDVDRSTGATYDELNSWSTDVARILTAAGIHPAGFLALPVDGDLVDYAVLMFAALKAGARPVAVPTLARPLAGVAGVPVTVDLPCGRSFTALAVATQIATHAEDPGDALYDETGGTILPRTAEQLRQLHAPRWPKLLPMLRGMAYSLDVASIASALMWQCWRGRTGYLVRSTSIHDLAGVVARHQLPSVAVTRAQLAEALAVPDLGHDVTCVKEVDLSYVASVSPADGRRIASRFPQAVGVGAPALDGRLRLLGARTAGSLPAQAAAAAAGEGPTAAASAPVPALTALIGSAAASYVDLLIGVLTRWVFEHEYLPTADPELFRRAPIDRQARAIGRDWPPDAETMAGVHRLRHLASCVATLVRDGVPGDLAEAGAWRGGSCILMRGVLKVLEQHDRLLWVADSFAGFPEQDYTLARTGNPAETTSYQFPLIAVDLPQVRANFARYGLLDEQVRFVPGWFHETLPTLPVDTLALIRLDGDLYDSTWAALSALYPRLSPGGYCVVDDYGDVTACREAVTAYRHENAITEPIEWIDTDAVFWRKSR